MSSDSRIEKMILKNFGLKTSDSPPHDFIYSDNPLTNLITIHKEQIHNNSMLLLLTYIIIKAIQRPGKH